MTTGYNPQRSAPIKLYDAAAARVCYGMALELFKRRLGEGDIMQRSTESDEIRH